ncbi:MAG: AAA-like domain-containing protein [Deltaproteobacteria bacterium]|nr:AAA-like domain-containing protein [Deltaproteobacteria bacterium]
MIEGKYYFVIHAPHQSGKTTFLNALTDEINAQGKIYALYCTLEVLNDVDDVDRAMSTIASQIMDDLDSSGVYVFEMFASTYDPNLKSNFDTIIRSLLRNLTASLDKDLVIFFDEADCLSSEPLMPFLGQIRSGYNSRHRSPKSKFPRSLALVGMRDIRDYLVQVRPETESRGLASPFNIKKGTFTLANFSRTEIETLYRQHTEATGQVFEASAVDQAWHWSEGQPWLVNALADQIVVEDLKNDFSVPVTGEHMDRAAETLILRRDAHLDYLLERLKEPRVRRVMEPVIIGARRLPVTAVEDDRRHVLDLGLLKRDEDSRLQMANPIYQEVILRTLARHFEDEFDEEASEARSNRWADGDRLDMTSPLKSFQKYWRENSDALAEPNGYSEALAHLALNAFLQRIFNGGVKVLVREYALGRHRLALFAEGVACPIELKIKSRQTLKDSLKQLRKYMDIYGASEGWLVVFDNDADKSMDEKITWETLSVDGATIHVVGC